MKTLCVMHVPFETPGSILSWAEENNIKTELCLAGVDSFPCHDSYDLLAILGGPMNIYEEDLYPWLKDEKAFIHGAIEQGKTILGFCLGAQLLSDALGGKVTRNEHPEIGWHKIKTFGYRQAKHFSTLPPEFQAFSWHGDTFSVPPGALALAESAGCKNQAFSCEDRIFGFQFHLESTIETISALIENCKDELVPGPYVQTAEELLRPDFVKEANGLMAGLLESLKNDFCQRVGKS
ncbi:MAG: type 1 glutamine amidotransferase [Clostridiales bacterium]|nr:type 1 glutamine amidotransferase [Clostridiales bacterium]